MTNPASGTAIGPMLAVAAEQYTPQAQRLVQDELACQLSANDEDAIKATLDLPTPAPTEAPTAAPREIPTVSP